MDWVLVAVTAGAVLVAIAVAGRQRRAVRVQQERLRQLESRLDSALAQQQPAPGTPPAVQNPSAQNPDDISFVGYPQYANRRQPRFGPDPRLDEVLRLVREGKKIRAIKVYRELTGVGLAEAKAAVEGLTR
ncbi:ribosomal protein L7/L12 [Microlunatus soli]|uniref:Ribosomal protein L7/L12 C-terminal domain-containing protein n=1 Tax=Microlunatus soli TaxID=630515 RepID=A0A1H2AK90_9ACTN|nr:ribosomal protein L7/L12 [Microlunatus soli]SDT46257.1 Ribosomal protein L7/L12 C-terminal domain-containing protein [Microlunatus soli]